MAARIREEDITLVRERSPIADVVGDYVALRNAGGGSLKGLCPFHDEKTPSFNVTPARGFFHCFGCGAGGDVIRFVEQIEHLSFVEAVERLAARAGIQLRYKEGGSAPIRQSGQRARLVEVNARAQRFYAEQLDTAEAKVAREFLASRGFEDAAIRTHGCGFAPGGWDALTKHLLANGFSQKELVAAGVARESSRGGVIDRFHRRLLWPIKDITGDVIGFGARRLFDDDRIEAKYLNTPETSIYKKSQVLYGVDLAKREIAQRHQVVIVEGYTDVMACHESGVPTAVATCGTSFGAEHIRVLRRLLMDQNEFQGEVIFTFDGDEAGQKAALRAFEQDQSFVGQTFVAVEPGGMDPCELRQAKGSAAVRDLVARRRPLFEFALSAELGRFDLDTVEGRARALERTGPLILKIRDRATRPGYARWLAHRLGVSEQDVLTRLSELSRGVPAHNGATRRAARTEEGDPVRLAVEREVLKLAVQAPVLAGPLFDAVDESAFVDQTHAAIRRAIAGLGGVVGASTGPEWVSRVVDELPDLHVRSVVSELAVERLQTQREPDTRYVSEVMARLQSYAITSQIVAVKSKLQRMNPEEHPEEYARLAGELWALEQYNRGLRDQAVGDS